jgi:hypothetical protein
LESLNENMLNRLVVRRLSLPGVSRPVSFEVPLGQIVAVEGDGR